MGFFLGKSQSDLFGITNWIKSLIVDFYSDLPPRAVTAWVMNCGNFYSAALARFLPNLSDALNMYSHGGQGRPQSDWTSWQILQERCLRSKLLSPFAKWESSEDTTVALVAALSIHLFYHTHTYLQAHTWGVIRVGWCLGFSDTAAGVQTVTWKLTPSLRAAPPSLSPSISIRCI